MGHINKVRDNTLNITIQLGFKTGKPNSQAILDLIANVYLDSEILVLRTILRLKYSVNIGTT